MERNDLPDTTYTTTWSNGHGDVRFFTRADGSRLRYYTAGTGPPLVLMHTVRTQLDYFQRVIPLLWSHYTVSRDSIARGSVIRRYRRQSPWSIATVTGLG